MDDAVVSVRSGWGVVHDWMSPDMQRRALAAELEEEGGSAGVERERAAHAAELRERNLRAAVAAAIDSGQVSNGPATLLALESASAKGRPAPPAVG